ncbi:MAG: hypothetical protein M0Q19_08180 [Candidatus Cloacimonetes bacterium]|nr:hypothetical protein [Candidatus Cloacimonadota bacterium]
MKQLILILALILSSISLLAISALHVSPQTFVPGTDVELLLEIVQGHEEISTVEVQYRAVGTTKWYNEPMRQDDPNSLYWRGIIPRTAVKTDDIEYRFEFIMPNGSSSYLPTDDGITPLYTIKLNAPKGSLTEGFVLVSDESSVSADDGYVLAVSYLALSGDLDPKSIRVFVGDRDVTHDSEIGESVLVYREDRPQDGIKKAMVTAKVKGAEVYSDTWITQVLPGSQKPQLPFTYRGSVNFSANMYSVSNKDNAFSDPDDDYRTWTDLYGSYGIADLQANLLVSSLEDKNKQPVNRYTFGVQIPMLDVFFGDYSPSLSQFTMSGKNIRGLYSRFHTRYLELSWAHGESIRKTKTEADPILGTNASGTFKQEAIGARLQFGNDQSFRLGVTGTRYRDIISSLDKGVYQYTDDNGDTAYNVKAQDNAVVALDMQLNVPDQNVMAGIELAGSILNNNTIPGPISSEELDEYGIDLVDIDPADYADYFVINKNMEPFLPSKANVAWTGYLRMYFLNNFLNVQYTETGSAFNSLGTYNQLNDTKVISITDQYTLGHLLTMSGGFSTTEDNLMKHKSETNSYQNIFAQAILRYPNMPYIKASLNSSTGKNKNNPDIDSEFEPYNRKALNMSFGIGYNIVQIPQVPTQVDISYRLGSSESERKPDENVEKITENANNGLAFTMNNSYLMLPLRTQISFATASNKDKLGNATSKNSSFFLKAYYELWENRLNPYVSYRNTSLSGDYDSQTYNYFNLGVESYPINNMTVTADLGLKNYKNKDYGDADYDATTFRLCLTQRF